MKFLPLCDFDVVTSALNFDTPDCHVTGGCDLYTTKAAGSDKKLYKNIDRSLESQHEAMLKFGASLSPPQRSSLNLSRSSPFGPLSDVSSRKTFAYLIATLNASHPDYDFSHVLRPADFKRERPLRRVMTNLNETLRSARPNAQPTVDFPVSALLLSSATAKKSKKAAKTAAAAAAAAASSGIGCSPPAVYGTESPPWGPHMWALLDKEMTLKDCAVFSYQPALNPFEEEAAAIWSLHYFFFNKERKRVSYLYVRAVPVVSHNSTPPPSFFRASQGFTSSLSAMMAARRRSSAMPMTPPGPAGNSSSSGTAAMAGGSEAQTRHKRSIGVAEEEDHDAEDGDDAMVATSFGSEGAHKRARFWLGDRATSLSTTMSEDDEDEFYADDGLIWNRDRDGTLELDEFAGSYDDAEDDGYTYGGLGAGGGVAGWGDVFSEEEDEDGGENDGDDAEVRTIRYSHGSRRDTSEEDIAGRMEIE